MPYHRIVTISAATLALLACGGPPKPPPVQGNFVAETRNGGIKLFTYIEKMRIPEVKPVKQTLDPKAEAMKMAKYQPAEQLKSAELRLKKDPRLSAFCPTGYTAIDKYAVLNEIVIRGECRYGTETTSAPSD